MHPWHSHQFPFVLRSGIRIAFPKSMADNQRTEVKNNLNNRSARRRPVLAIVFSVTLGAIGVWYWTSRSADSSPNAEPRIRSTLHLETFVLNLADTDQRSYLRGGIDLGLNREMKREEAAPVAEVRDTILGVLGESKVEALTTAEGKAKLKEN